MAEGDTVASLGIVLPEEEDEEGEAPKADAKATKAAPVEEVIEEVIEEDTASEE
jgi:hypothetical protein